MPTFMKQFVDLIYPKGPAHEPVESGQMDLFREGIADNIDVIRTLYRITNPIRHFN